ncbi:Uma2 family endonuclease [Kitasatospora kifunensis]|uniref:Uma2 family endonuclease n=1 Tax=Kitasatospora kifunensis TaxID=58351 RepID=A0A7W7R116_KITKI|nr:Uma2 family endonuclease [Kitasatospora kifunensis]MBB4923407.1 Uma2 family endonuclease [Kitasatospora kifunensis]
MTALMHEVTVTPSDEGDGLLDAFLELETPEGFKAELIEGEIILSPPPDGDHEAAIGRIVRQVFRRCEADLTFAGHKGLIVPDGRYIPDGTFADEGAFDGQPPWMLPDRVQMVVEVTSTDPSRDREAKRTGYAAAGIPLYLLVDRKADKVVLHSNPKSGDYRRVTSVAVGTPLDLPAPFGFALETERLT